MTGPGLPSSPLPEGVLQAHQLGAALQGLNAAKVGDTAEARLPEVFTGTLGGELVNAPIKYVLGLFAEFLGDIVDDGTPAITGPDELQDRIHDFFEDLPLVGIFVSIADAMLGNYDGDDPALLAVQDLFGLLRKLLELVSGVSGDLPELGDVISGFEDLASAVGGLIEGLFKIPLWQLDSGGVEVIDRFDGLSTVEEVEGWSWDEVDGHDQPGCALFTATGTPGVLLSPTPVEVREGEQYTVSAWAKATGTSGGGISLGVQWFDGEHVALSSSTAQSVGSPASSWTQLSGQVTVPAGAKYSRRMLTVEATAGEVRWDDVRFAGVATTIPQEWVKDLAESLQDVIDWVGALVDELLGALGVPALGDLFDRISDLADEVSGWLDDTQDRAAELSDLIGDLLSNPASVIGTLPQTLISDASGWLNSSLAGKAAQSAVDSINTFLLGLANAILEGIRKVPVVGGTIAGRIEDVIEELSGLKDETSAAAGTATAAQSMVSSAIVSVEYVTQLVNVRSGAGIWETGVDPTGTVSIPFHSADTTITANATTAPWASIRFRNVGDISIVQFIASASSQPSTFYVDLYRMEDDGSSTLLYSSSNLAGEIGTSPQWIAHPIDTPIPTELGDVLEVQFRASSTVNLAGDQTLQPTPIIGFRPYTPGSVRNPWGNPAPATIATATRDAMYTTGVPFVSLGIDLGQFNAPRVFVDSFTSLASTWTYLSGRVFQSGYGDNTTYSTPQVSSGRLYATAATTRAIYSRESRTGKMFTEATIGIHKNNDGLTAARTGIALGVNSATHGTPIVTTGGVKPPAGIGIYATFNSGSWRLYAHHSGDTNILLTSPGTGEHRVRVEYDADTEQARYFVNGTPYGGNPVSVTDPGNRGFGIRSGATDSNYGSYVDDWTAGELEA